jgi:catechol 2,3-dioxygenase-like lactoylglutathione lyase family enzyme
VFDHVTIRAGDRAASERFYDTVLATLGIRREDSDLRLAPAEGGAVTRRFHIGFRAPSRAEVDEFWRVGTEAGYRDDGPPGPRPEYTHDYYGSFLLDPDGNSAEAVHHGAMRGAAIDHIWMRVSDLAAVRRFYEELAPHAGFRVSYELPERVGFVGATGAFSLVAGEPSRHVHLGFAARDAAVAGRRLDPEGNLVELVRR